MIGALWLVLAAAPPVVIENVRVEVGDGTVLESATVVLERQKIARVSTEAVAAPEGAVIIDGRGKVLTPGLIDVNARLGVSEVELEKSTNDHALDKQPLAPGFRVADGFNPLSVWIPIERSQGITSAIVRPSTGVLAGTGPWVDLTGRLDSAPDASRPVAMFGSVDASAAALVGEARGGLWLKLREVFADARFYARNRAAVEGNRARPLALPPLHLEALQPVLDGKLPLVLHADRASDIALAIAFARAEKLRLVISGAGEAHLVAAELAAAKVPVVVTPSRQMPSSFDTVRARDDIATLLDQAGVQMAISSTDGNSRRLRQEAGIAVAYGLDRAKALRAITLSPAEIFGKAAELGSVAVGKRANVVLWSGDPLELSSRAERVFIDGVEQPGDHRQKRLLERYLRR